ncbi:HAD hydrolase-like protein, partial [bacterium]|nr:HAD hydrolase-like protein [bacterium]
TKESGALTKIALEKLGANPQATIMIGDAPMDYISAKNAGIENTILVATGQIRAEELQQTSSFVVGSLSEIEIV